MKLTGQLVEKRVFHVCFLIQNDSLQHGLGMTV